jgi:hypothetical protein
MTATIAYPTFAVPWPGALHSAKNASARGHPQNQGEEVAQSPEQPPQRTLTPRLFHAVGAKFAQSALASTVDKPCGALFRLASAPASVS